MPSLQALSGTGALRLAAEFYLKFLPAGTEVHISDPSWGNHAGILKTCGIPSKAYRYLDRATNRLDFDGMLADINAAAPRSVFLLHACAHNPTGIDPTPAQWKEISAAVKAKQHHVLMDSAYQGFASGDAEADASALRAFVADGHSLVLAQSFAKNFGLYGAHGPHPPMTLTLALALALALALSPWPLPLTLTTCDPDP